MPKEIQYHPEGLDDQTKLRLRFAAAAVITIISVVLIWRFVLPFFSEGGSASSSTQPASSAAVDESLIDQQTDGGHTQPESDSQPPPSEISTSHAATPSLVLTSTAIPLLQLDTPIGDEYIFIIHRVEEGETLNLYAERFNTSVGAIQSINYYLLVPIWVDWIVVIPVDITDVDHLPAFEAHMVEEKIILLSTLAEQLSVSVEEMARYNNIDAEYVLKAGDWLLVPRE